MHARALTTLLVLALVSCARRTPSSDLVTHWGPITPQTWRVSGPQGTIVLVGTHPDAAVSLAASAMAALDAADVFVTDIDALDQPGHPHVLDEPRHRPRGHDLDSVLTNRALERGLPIELLPDAMSASESAAMEPALISSPRDPGYARTHRWMRRLNTLLARGFHAVVAVRAENLVGRHGMLRRLSRLGYRVEPSE